MSKDVNQFKSPVPGLDYDLEGPTADHLIDTSEWDTKSVYTHIHALQDEWEVVDVSEATPYLPKRKTPLPVIVGIDEKKEYDLGTFEHIKLSEQLKYKKGYVINTGINIWGLDFVPKTPVMEEEDSKIQYLAVTGYRGSTEEHIGIGDIQPTGTYKNAIQIWKLSLSVHEQVDPVLDMCLLHDFGVIFDLKWCPYGTYQE
ncbi:uncharacterized protein EV154DRAFT_428336, partial [Mucor mucedo]|uniref:uncharacterized protein n=1 Tax=Mucor mucedo TaxID=29922 RepID=UPI00221FC236